jgi:hypothetical protein
MCTVKTCSLDPNPRGMLEYDTGVRSAVGTVIRSSLDVPNPGKADGYEDVFHEGFALSN